MPAAPPPGPLSRRSLLAAAAAAVPAAALAQDGTRTGDGTLRPDGLTGREAVDASVTAGPHPGVIVRQWEPRNLEYPLPSLDGRVTPTNQFYVRSHFPVPEADPATWTLTVAGLPGPAERRFTLADLEALGTEERTVTMECAGNGRIFLVPKPGGLLWETGGVGTAVWRGTPLRAVLGACGVVGVLGSGLAIGGGLPNVQLTGADRGKLSKYPAPLHYSRGLPFDKATDDVLLATHMNGEPLPPHHGFPLRAVVPGWYGAASVKWLDKITLTGEPDRGFFSTFDYATFEGPQAQLTPLTAMQVKSSLARPARGERVKAGETYVCRGAAWTGGGETVRRVEFSGDGGVTWADATLVDDPAPNVWTRWRYDWTPATEGDHTLMSRATDSAGATQPAGHDPLHRAYKIHHTVPVHVEVV